MLMIRKAMLIIFLLSLALMTGAEDRALLVGIGKYDTKRTGWSRLHGDRDADMIRDALLRNGVKKENIITVKNEQATKAGIIEALKEFAATCKPGDRALLLFSCHGQPVTDLNKDESKKPFDEAIVAYDACRTSRYKNGEYLYNGENHLIDDELNPLLQAIKKRLGKSGYLFVAFDACFSEGLEMAKSMVAREDVDHIGPIRGTSEVFLLKPGSSLSSVPKPKGFSGGARMAVVSACRDNERNYEYRHPTTRQVHGSLSYCLLRLLDSGNDFKGWEAFFENEQYKEWNIFISLQHPEIKIYR